MIDFSFPGVFFWGGIGLRVDIIAVFNKEVI